MKNKKLQKFSRISFTAIVLHGGAILSFGQ